MFLVVYVDDFKMAGPASLMEQCWTKIRRGIKTDDPSPLGKYLGCDHIAFERIHPNTGKMVRGIEYDVSAFMSSCVDRYLELSGLSVASLKKVATPFPIESKEPCKFRDVEDHSLSAYVASDQLDVHKGHLQPHAAKILMKILYGARMALSLIHI